MSDRMISPFARDHFYSTVGAAIVREREQLGMHRSDLARKAKLAVTTVEHAEKGEACSLMIATMIAEALDIPLNALVPLDALR